MKIRKRDGRLESLSSDKIAKAIIKSTNGEETNNTIIAIDPNTNEKIHYDVYKLTVLGLHCLDKITEKYKDDDIIDIEIIHNEVISYLKDNNLERLADNYSEYREERNKSRMRNTELMKTVKYLSHESDLDNGNVGGNFSAKLLRIASEANKCSILGEMPKELSRAHEIGDIYYHDLDSYNIATNCLHIPADEALANGFNTGYGQIKSPNRIDSASMLICILIQSVQNDQYGGVSIPDLNNTLAPYVVKSRDEIIDELIEDGAKVTDEKAERKLRKRVRQGMQNICYNLNTMHSRAGSQVPFSSVNIGLPLTPEAALIDELFLEEFDKGMGKGTPLIFPNLIFRVKDGVNKKKGDPYYYLYKLACKVAAKRMNPTFLNIDTDFNLEYYNKGIVAATMGCRTAVLKNVNGQAGPTARGNIGNTTINMPRIGILSNRNIDKFFELFDSKIELAKESLLHRKETLSKLRVKDLPFIAGQKLFLGSEGLSDQDSILPLLEQGTYGIGFVGLAETLVALLGTHHGQSKEARELGEKIISHLREKCDEYSLKYSLNFSCYATPNETCGGKMCMKDIKKFGIIEGVTNKEFYTNSFHIPVNFPITIMDKIKLEAPYHKLCNGGHISYIEIDDYPNPELVEKIITKAFTETNIAYIGVNFHIRYCKECGSYLHDQTICDCGSGDIQGVSRITGYLALDERFGEPKQKERSLRIDHNATHEKIYDMIK